MQSGRCALRPRQLRRATIWTAGRDYYEQKRESGSVGGTCAGPSARWVGGGGGTSSGRKQTYERWGHLERTTRISDEGFERCPHRVSGTLHCQIHGMGGPRPSGWVGKR